MATASSKPVAGGGDDDQKEEDQSRFECNICYETATDAVVSMCGHLYCWPCIHRWMQARSGTPTCPVCKAVIDKERLIPLYGRGSSDKTDPREKVPPRPQGQREEATDGYVDDSDFNGGINLSFGLGFPPFGVQMFNVNNFGGIRGPLHHGRRFHGNMEEAPQQRQAARIMLTLAILFIIMIIFS